MRGYSYGDFAAVLDYGCGLLDRTLGNDGVNPLGAGYARMEPVARALIADALQR